MVNASFFVATTVSMIKATGVFHHRIINTEQISSINTIGNT